MRRIDQILRQTSQRTALAGCLLTSLLVSPAWACGYCVEDKIAAVYDHAIVTRTVAAQHRVVFFAIDGPIPSDIRARESILRAARAVRGVAPDSVRVSLESAALSLAFDPARTSLAALQKSIERQLAEQRLTLLPLRVMDRLAKFDPA